MNEAGEKNTLFHKNLSGQANASEKAQLNELLASENEKNNFEQVSQIWNLASDIDFKLDTQTDQEWNSLLSNINSTRQTKVRTLNTSWFRAVAAAIAIGLISTAVWFMGPFAGEAAIAATYQTKATETQTFKLNDGSTIYLNNESVLQVVEGFNKKERKLIFEGEAYFQVASNKAKPFQIQTGDVTTTVVGTAFNLSAYANEEDAVIDVTEGIVRFTANDGQEVELRQGMAAKYNIVSGKISKIEYNEGATLWQKGILSFDNTPFQQVIQTLERYYGIQITDNKGLSNDGYSSTFDNLSQEEVLQVLEETFDFQYKVEGKEVIIF